MKRKSCLDCMWREIKIVNDGNLVAHLECKNLRSRVDILRRFDGMCGPNAEYFKLRKDDGNLKH